MILHNLIWIFLSIIISIIEFITHIIPVGFILWMLNFFWIDILNTNIIVLSVFIIITIIIIWKIIIDKFLTIVAQDKWFFWNTTKILMWAITIKDYLNSLKTFLDKNSNALLVILLFLISLFSISYNNIKSLNDLLVFTLWKDIFNTQNNNTQNNNTNPHTINLIINTLWTKILNDYLYNTYNEVKNNNSKSANNLKWDICDLYKKFNSNTIQWCNNTGTIVSVNNEDIFFDTQSNIVWYSDMIKKLIDKNNSNNRFDLHNFLWEKYKKNISKDYINQYNAIIALKELDNKRKNIFFIEDKKQLADIVNNLSIILKKYKESAGNNKFKEQIKNICKIYYFIWVIEPNNKTCNWKLTLKEIFDLNKQNIINIIDNFKVKENTVYIDKIKSEIKKAKTLNYQLINNINDNVKKWYIKVFKKYKDYRDFTILTDSNLNNYLHQKKKLLGFISFLTLNNNINISNIDYNKVYKLTFFPIEPISNSTITNMFYYIFLTFLVFIFWVVIITVSPILDIIFLFANKDKITVSTGIIFVYTIRFLLAIWLYAFLFNLT